MGKVCNLQQTKQNIYISVFTVPGLFIVGLLVLNTVR